MKQGKIAESVLKRSVFKQLHLKRPDVLMAAGIGEDCAAFAVAEDEVAVISAEPGDLGRFFRWTVCRACESE